MPKPNYRFTRKDHRIGARVEIPPHMDAWMRGTRIGTVVMVGEETTCRAPTLAKVRMDNPLIRRLVVCEANDLRFIQ